MGAGAGQRLDPCDRVGRWRLGAVIGSGSVEPGEDGDGRVTLPTMDPEPGEEVFFHGHPSWRSMLAFYIKGFFLGGGLAGAIVGDRDPDLREAASNVPVGGSRWC